MSNFRVLSQSGNGQKRRHEAGGKGSWNGETGCLPGAFVRKTPVTSDFDSFAQENYKNSFKMNIDQFSFF